MSIVRIATAFIFFLQDSYVSTALQFPSACPSHEYIAANRKISIRPVDWCDGILPLQHYHAVKQSKTIFGMGSSGNWHDINGNSQQNITLEVILDDLAAYDLSHSSRSMLEEHERLSTDQKAQLLQKILAEQRARQPVPLDALEILYCDAHICVVNKPSGVLSVPGPRRNPSLAEVVYNTIRPEIDLDQMVVHRLDMATSGILVYALSLQALSQLHSDFKSRRVQKTYQALVQGHIINQEGEVDVYMERDITNPPFMRIAQPKPTGIIEENDNSSASKVGMTHKFYTQAPKESLTTWSLLGHEYIGDQPVSRLDLRPWTGRTHQLRVHCAQALGSREYLHHCIRTTLG